MALFEKQDFTPRVLSKRWVVMKFRPNMLVYSQDHILAILESGLLFREDSIEIEQDGPEWMDPESLGGAWLTTGERVVSAMCVCASLAMFPPRSFTRWSIIRLTAYLALPVAFRTMHRRRCAGSVPALIRAMCDYLSLARRAAACCREYATLYAKLASVVTIVESMQALLIRQQSDMVNLLSRISSSVLGNVPWVNGDVAWEAVCRPGDSLMRIHHTFLVVQSLLLKHLAMAHYQADHVRKVYKNHNERIYWIHTVVIQFLMVEYKENFESLERMYRLLKNCATIDPESEAKKPGTAICNNWLYSEVHTDVARSCLELKIALSKSNSIDRFLDSSGLNKTEVDLDVLNKDIEDLIDNITKCLSTAQNSQKRLKKLQGKLKETEEVKTEEVVKEVNVVKVEEKVPEAKDEVFYFVKTEDDATALPPGDILTGPGEKEKAASKVVLNELKRKLGKREDMMRERERQALKKTMPEYKDNVPEFPRQIQMDEFVERRGYIEKLRKLNKKKRRLFLHYKITRRPASRLIKEKMLKLKNAKLVDVNLLLTNTELLILKNPNAQNERKFDGVADELDSSGMSDGESDGEEPVNRNVQLNKEPAKDNTKKLKTNDARNFRFSKRELELSPSSSDSDEGAEERAALLIDARRHRATRKRNSRKPEADEGLRPVEYSFGAGMAMAGVLQLSSGVRGPPPREEVFVGDGQLSPDSGNSE